MNKKEYIQIIMPPLIKLWEAIEDNDKRLIPLIECITYVAISLGEGFLPFIKPIFNRSLRLIKDTYELEKSQGTEFDDQNKDFIVCSLELISGLIESLGSSIESLFLNTSALNLIYFSMRDEVYVVRQASFAVIGELAKSCIGLIKDDLGEILKILIKNLKSHSCQVKNNASWSISEIAMKVGSDFKPFVEEILSDSIETINTHKIATSLLENTSVLIGRLAYVCPDVVSEKLDLFSKNWCLSLKKIRNHHEKEEAYKGLIFCIKKNPKGVLNTFAYVCETISSYHDSSNELSEEFYSILHGFKKKMGDKNFEEYLSNFPEDIYEILKQKYKL
jgi:transportin-1